MLHIPGEEVTLLTEVDTREVCAGKQVSLYMDIERGRFLICATGHESLTTDDPASALQMWKHPFAYIPLEGHRSDSNGLRGGTEGNDSYGHSVSADRLTERTTQVLVELKAVLELMDSEDFHWTAGMVSDVIGAEGRKRERKPYDQELDDGA